MSIAPIRVLSFAIACVALACQPATTTTPPTTTSADIPPDDGKVVDTAWGGRFYDRWYTEQDGGFAPGKSGGPRGDGTLDNGAGVALPNGGHDYRLKNLFGWDLRGAEGVYGPEYQNRDYVLPVNLLTDTRTTDELTQWLTEGDDTTPAYGAVMKPEEIAGIVAFVDAVRTGALPGPEQVFALSKTAPKNYVLREGGNVERGRTLFADSCAGCHGDDGRKLTIDDDASLGLFMRTKAYEGWIKTLNGHPGTAMGREIEFESSAEGGAMILDIAAGLCDRVAFPSLDGVQDVPDGDPRCGAYLK